MVAETTGTMDSHHTMDFNLVETVSKQFDVDLQTLYAQAAKSHMEVNKQKHNHWRPPSEEHTITDVTC